MVKFPQGTSNVAITPLPSPAENFASHTLTYTHTHPLTNAYIPKEHRHRHPDTDTPLPSLTLKCTHRIKHKNTRNHIFFLQLREMHTYHPPSSRPRLTAHTKPTLLSHTDSRTRLLGYSLCPTNTALTYNHRQCTVIQGSTHKHTITATYHRRAHLHTHTHHQKPPYL